jgi:hypothetical protein
VSDETTQQSSSEGQAEAETSGASTPEDIEAYWRKRFSNSDKAHAAEAKVLREQLAALQSGKATEVASAESGAKEMTDMVSRLQADLAAERAARVIDTRKAKYPAAAQALGDEVIVQMDEARLAGLNESLTVTAPRVDANNPARRMSGSKPIEDMTSEEVKALFKQSVLPSW